MAEQEACAHAVTEALAAAGETVETEEQTGERGESLLLPLLQGLLQGDGQRLLAGLGAASHDVVADVRRSLQRLRLALAPPADHPQARALLALVDRLEDALDAADRLDGCKRRSRRRSRTARHTVGVTREELEEARRLVDRDQLLPEPERPAHAATATPATSSYTSTAPSTDEPPTPERKPSVDEQISFHDAVAAQERPRPVPHNVTYEATPKISRDACVVERRVATARKPDFYRHSIADAIRNETPKSAAERWHSETRKGIAAIAHKFDAKAEKENAAPIRRAPMTRAAGQQPAVTMRQKAEEDLRRASFYRPPPPTYNFAAPPSQDDFSRSSRFMSNKRNKIKRANTIDIGRPYGGYRVDTDTDEENTGAPKIPTFQPQTENDKKFLAFMQKNENMERSSVNGQSNWSSRFGNIKNTFEHRDHDEHSRSSSSSSSAKKFWQMADESTHRPRKPANDVAPEVIKPPWVSSRNNVRPQIKQTIPPATHIPHPSPPVPQIPHPSPPPQSANKPIPVKPFVAKPIPVNQFSHAPMSAFKPPKKIMSPTTTPNVWSPPSANIPVSPPAAHPPLPSILKPYPSVPMTNGHQINSAPHWKSEVDHDRRNGVQAANFEYNRNGVQAANLDYNHVHANHVPRSPQPIGSYRPTTPPTHVRHEPSYPIRAIPSQNRLAAPELVMKLEDTKTYPAPEPQSPKIDARQLQIEFYEKQIREKNRRDNSSERHENPLHKPPPPPPGSHPPATYTVVDYTPQDGTSTFVPLQQTPDIEKAKAHKIDYLPDVVMSENNSHEYVKSPTMRVSSASPSKMKIPPEYRNGGGGDDDPATEHGSVVTRVMRGPTRAAATITAGVRTRDAADSLRGVLDKISGPRHGGGPQPDRRRQEPARNQVRLGAPPQIRPSLSPQHAPSSPRPTHLSEHDGMARSPGAPRSPNLAASRESVFSSESPLSRDSSPGGPLARSGSWHRFGDVAPRPAPAAPATSARKVVARTKSMNLLAAPKLFEGGISQNEITEKKRTVEAYFSGQATRKAPAPQAPARGRGRAGAGFSLGRSRTMPTVAELQLLDESNADDAFEDLVSALA